MTAMSEAPRESFKLGMLVNDTRYRSYTFQTIAFLAICLLFGWLISNLLTNLARQGLGISFEFLGQAAGYDINQKPIPFDSQDTHLRAAIVGVMNTLIVAVLGCITATVLGVVAGVLRLSNNWIVSKLMSAYVEAFRNVPVLIWIIIIFSITAVIFPQPRDFRGDGASASMLFDAVAFTNRGIYVPAPYFTNGIGVPATVEEGLKGTVAAASAAWNWLIVIATLVASAIGARALTRWANAKQEATGERPATLLPRLAIWFLPILIVLTLLGLRWDFPELRGFNFQGGLNIRGSLVGLWLALAIYTGAFIAENVRAGIQAVSKGQTEAAASLGLRPSRIMNLVVLPQALRIIIPPLISQYLNLTKNSSLAIAVGYMDVTGTLGGITLNQTGRAIEAVLLLMLFYLIISLSISAVMNVYNNAVKLKER